jgi:signal transduction histidine kinase
MVAMARRRTLAERVVLAVTATVALLVGLQSILAYLAMHAQEDELSDTMLQREVQQIVAHIGQPGVTPAGQLLDSIRVQAWLARGGERRDPPPASVRTLAPGLYQLGADGKTLHVAVVDTEEGRLTVVLDATAAEERVHRFGYTMAALWLVFVGATIWIARAVAAIAVGPIVAATRTIARSAPGAPLGTSAECDEAEVMTETFQRFRDRVDQMVERERQFAANLDHEIRTPLTTIRTDAELLALEAELAEEQKARVDRIVAAVDEIVATTASTLSYSAGRTIGAEPVDLREVLLHACAAIHERAQASGLAIVVDVVDGERVEVDRQALLTVVRNLLRNAVEHAAPATLRVSGDRHAVVFSDDGPGIAPDRLARVFDERVSSGKRFDAPASPSDRVRGLGLTIAKRLCDLQGWQLAIRSPVADGHGTAFTLAFSHGIVTAT